MVHSQFKHHSKEQYFENAYSHLNKIQLVGLKKNLNNLQSDFEKYKNQVLEVINDKIYEKDISANSAFLKKEIRGYIKTLQNIND